MVQEKKPQRNVGAFYGDDFDKRPTVVNRQNLESQNFLNRTAI
jgi:hypothetical protein